jgi:hypothetical protein
MVAFGLLAIIKTELSGLNIIKILPSFSELPTIQQIYTTTGSSYLLDESGQVWVCGYNGYSNDINIFCKLSNLPEICLLPNNKPLINLGLKSAQNI